MQLLTVKSCIAACMHAEYMHLSISFIHGFAHIEAQGTLYGIIFSWISFKFEGKCVYFLMTLEETSSDVCIEFLSYRIKFVGLYFCLLWSAVREVIGLRYFS